MKKYLVIFFLLAMVYACRKDSASSRVVVILTDSPADYEKVELDVKEVHINYGASDNGWIVLPSPFTEKVDLLSLTGGVEATLSDTLLPSGTLSQIRLVLGSDNTITVGGQTYPLTIPSGSESGLKLNVHQSLEAGIEYRFVLDFDAAKSIVVQGNGNYKLKPTIKVSVEALTGQLVGSVANVGKMLVTISNGTTEFNTYTGDEGVFVFKGLEAGTYSLLVTPPDGTGLNTAAVGGIQIQVGKTTNLTQIVLDSKPDK
jgi:hypothetical protein